MDEEDLETERDSPAQRYDVVITGMRSGVERGAFLANLSSHLKVAPATLEPLFSPAGLVVKRSSDFATASKYVSALREWNCVCKMVRTGQPVAPPKFVAPQPPVPDPEKKLRTGTKAYKPAWIFFAIVATIGLSVARIHQLRIQFAGVYATQPDGGTNVAAGTSPDSDGSSNTNGLEVEIVKSSGFAHDSMSEIVTTAAPLDGGGFLVSTIMNPANSFLYRVAGSGEVIWRTDLSSLNEKVNSAGTAPDGTYWIAGQVPDATGAERDFTQPVTLEGKIGTAAILSTTSDDRFSHCMTNNGTGFVQISSIDTLDEYYRLPVPAVSMTNDTGDRIWEHVMPTVQGQRVQTSIGGPLSTDVFACAGIASDQKGRIIAAQRILDLPAASSKEDLDRQLASGASYGTLVVSLDAHGTEVASIRHDDVVGATLVGTPGGAVLFETPYERKNATDSTATGILNAVKSPQQTDSRLHMYTFDANLKEIRPPIVFAGTRRYSVDAAFLTPEGGLLITGCPGDGGSRYILYVDASGAMSPRHSFSQLGENCSGYYRISKGESPGEALLLAQSPLTGNRLYTLKYLN